MPLGTAQVDKAGQEQGEMAQVAIAQDGIEVEPEGGTAEVGTEQVGTAQVDTGAGRHRSG